MALNRLLMPFYRIIATTEASRTECSLTDFWPQVFAWCAEQPRDVDKICCERFTLEYLMKKHVGVISVKSFNACLARVEQWRQQHDSPYVGFDNELHTLHVLADSDARGFVVVQEKDYPNLVYLIPGIEALKVKLIEHSFYENE